MIILISWYDGLCYIVKQLSQRGSCVFYYVLQKLTIFIRIVPELLSVCRVDVPILIVNPGCGIASFTLFR